MTPRRTVDRSATPGNADHGSTSEPASLVVGLIGSGINASLSPALQEGEARAQGVALAYRIIDLDGTAPTDVAAVLDWGERLGFDGFNVTYPAKQMVRQFLHRESEAATLLGAVNTVVMQKGRRIGHNTDWVGFDLGLGWQLGAVEGPVIVLGAGGAGAAVVHALLARGLEVKVSDLDPGRVADLIGRLGAHHPSGRLAAVRDLAADLGAAHGLVNATAVGMAAHPGIPLDANLLRPELWVADCVYRPLDTELLRAARGRGCRVAHGGGMVVYQAAAGFELFTGRPADTDRMKTHLEALIADPSTA